MSTCKYLPEGNLIQTSENREFISSYSGLVTAMETGRILEANAILCDSDMTLTVDLGGIRGIIERDEVVYLREGEELKNIAIITRVGKPVCFKVMSFRRGSDGMPVAILSRAAAQRECVANYLLTKNPGDILPARVTHLEHFGAFVDIGCGVVSLLSIDCISVSRIAHPRDRFAPGMAIRTVLKSIDRESGRIYVSHKELLGTWSENAARYSVGQTVSGIIRSVEDYGIFVELAPNLAGLAECRDDMTPTVGSRAAVYIKNIIPDRMKIKLVLIDSYGGELDDGDLLCDIDKIEYFIPRSTEHIDEWRYSPDCCDRVVETVFDGDGATQIQSRTLTSSCPS